MSELMT